MKDLKRGDRVAADVERGMAPRELLLHAGEGTTFAAEPCEGIDLSGRFHFRLGSRVKVNAPHVTWFHEPFNDTLIAERKRVGLPPIARWGRNSTCARRHNLVRDPASPIGPYAFDGDVDAA